MPLTVLAYLVISCFERWFPKQNTVARLKLKDLPTLKFAVATPLAQIHITPLANIQNLEKNLSTKGVTRIFAQGGLLYDKIPRQFILQPRSLMFLPPRT